MERFEKLFNAYIIGLFSMLSLNIALLSRNLLANILLYKIFEILSFVLFLDASIIIIKNTATAYIIHESKEDIEKDVEDKTLELHQKVRELEDSRTATIHILRDLDKSKDEIEKHSMELEKLNEIMLELTSELSLYDILNKLAENAKNMFGARYAAIGILDKSGKSLSKFITSGLTKEELSKLKGQHNPTGKGVLGALYNKKTPLILKDLTKYEGSVGFPPGHPMMRSFLGISIISKNKIFGNIFLTEKQGGFTNEDAELLKTLALEAGIAIENARLYSDLDKAFNELKDLDRYKSDIISNVSHELRTPITIISGVLELLDDEEDLENRKQLIKMAHETLGRQNRIVEDLIAATSFRENKIELNLEPISIGSLLSLVYNQNKANAKEKNVNLSLKIGEDIPPIYVDFKQLEHALKDIIHNAIKFSKESGGTVIIETKSIDKYVEISINDKGVGIPEDKLNRIFDPLYQGDASTSRAYEGTGMGLAIAKRIVNAHNGNIRAESILGEGTKIIITLPASNE